MRPVAVVLLALACASTVPVAAQVTRADSAAVLLESARRLAADGQRDAASALIRQLLSRYSDTPAGREAAGMVARADSARAAGVERAGSGRFRLLAWSAIYGAWLGIALPATFEADDPQTYGIGLLLGGPGAIVLANEYAQRARPTGGQAAAIAFGSMWGWWQGLGWRGVFDIGDREVTTCDPYSGCYTYSDESETAPQAAMVLGSLTGIAAGGVLGRRLRPTVGQVTLVNHAAWWGTWYGVVLGVLLDQEHDSYLTTVLLAGNAALAATALSAPRTVASSRVWLATGFGIAGGAAGLGIDLLIEVDDAKLAITIPALTSLVGLSYGWQTGSDMDRRPGVVPVDEPGALLNVYGGRARLGVPPLRPAAVPAGLRPNGRRAFRPGLALDLVQARF